MDARERARRQLREMKGQPTAGRFAKQRRDSAQVQLLEEPVQSRWLPDDFEINEEFPLPQANDLDKIALTVRAVRNEAVTASAIAEVLDVTPREGDYYASAAGYLGLLESSKDEEGRTVFHSTSTGNLLDTVEGDERAEVLAEIVDQVPGVQAYLEGGEEAVLELYAMDGRVNGTTAARRAATISSWVDQTSDPGELTSRCQDSIAGGESRIADAVAACMEEARQRRAARIAAQEAAKPKICMTHFVQLPATGICDQCAEEAAA